jgi:hypothetical protein
VAVAANRYAYGNNNPLGNTDPTGHFAWALPLMAIPGANVVVGTVAVVLAAGYAYDEYQKWKYYHEDTATAEPSAPSLTYSPSQFPNAPYQGTATATAEAAPAAPPAVTVSGSSGGGRYSGGGGSWRPRNPIPWLLSLRRLFTKDHHTRVDDTVAAPAPATTAAPGELDEDDMEKFINGWKDGARPLRGNPQNNWRISISDARTVLPQAELDKIRERRDGCFNVGWSTPINYWDVDTSVVGLDGDNRPRATGAEACWGAVDESTGGPADLEPRGFTTNHVPRIAAGHLIAHSLGGSGDDERNLVTVYQDQVNVSAMSWGVERPVKRLAEKNNVYYRVTPHYPAGSSTGYPDYVEYIVAVENVGIVRLVVTNQD